MISLHALAIAPATAAFCVTGYAQMPAEQGARPPTAVPTDNMRMPMGSSDAQMARLDEQMQTMQAMHDKMMKAKTPEERSALMAEHMKVMQDSMAMLGETGTGGMMGKGSMGAMKDKPSKGTDTGGMPDMLGKGPMDGDMAAHRQMMEEHMRMMEKRMQMMQSMMQMMMDRMSPVAGKS